MIKTYDNCVFINCPFDDEYKEVFYAIVFTVYRCGFIPRSALEEQNGLDNRLSKIKLLIEACKYGIHDLSRTESNDHDLPRFNMPFELGIFFGAKQFGSKKQKSKVALILEKEKYLYQQYISDLNGIDTQAHNNDSEKAIKIVRNWLQISSGRKVIDGHLAILKDYKTFRSNLPVFVNEARLDIDDLPFNDYCLIVETLLAPFMQQ